MTEAALDIYSLPGSTDTPKVHLDPNTGRFEFDGASYPEDTVGFFTPLFSWMNEHLHLIRGPLVVEFRLEYINSSSSKCFLDLFDILDEFAALGGKVTVNWRYQEDDEEMEESGLSFSEGLCLNFNLIPFP